MRSPSSATVGDPALVQWCRAQLGAAPVRELFTRRQTSRVVGYRLDDGRHIVIKFRRDSLARVDACLTLQAALFAANYPCPRPLTSAAVIGGLTVHAEDYVDRGEALHSDDATIAAPLAIAFGDLLDRLERLQELVDPELLTLPVWAGWWSQRPWTREPLVPDFVYDAADRLRARLARVDLPGVVGHADWESQNMRWSNGRVVVVHDWDSLAYGPEALLTGVASGVFPAQSQPELATISGSATFLEHYQTVRGRGFSAEEMEVAWAGGLVTALHNARNEALEQRRPLVLERLEADCDRRLDLAGA